MSMTENEAISQLKYMYKTCIDEKCKHKGQCDLCCEARDMAIQALEEVQQYRAIGTIEEFKALKEKNETLKALYKDARKEGNSLLARERNKAIDEFAERMSLEISESIIWDMIVTMNKNSSLSDTSDKIVDYVIDTAKKIAEEMKAGDENA